MRRTNLMKLLRVKPLRVKPLKVTDDFLSQSFLGVACVSLLLLLPFSINNFVQARYWMGFGSFLITGIFGFNAWSILQRDRYYAALTLFALVPAILIFLAVALITQGLIGVFWCYPAVVTFYFILPERKAWLANIALLVIALPLASQILEPALAVRLVVTLIMVSIFSVIFIRVITRQQQVLLQQIATDPLTGLLNRTSLADTLGQVQAQYSRTGTPMTLIALDIDFFKRINDTFGHDVGDRVIRDLAVLMLARIRQVDRAFRLGGEEFLVVLYGAPIQHGKKVAEELCREITSLQSIPNYKVTVSAGVAELQKTETWQMWMKRSDENLYRAKTLGRNRVEV